MKVEKRGGKREGAGRPNFLGAKTTRLTLPAEYGPILRELGIKLHKGSVNIEDVKKLLE